jgi:hypothetical protein
MNKAQRDFLTWWLINYGTNKVDFYKIRDTYLGDISHTGSIGSLYDGTISSILFGHTKGFSSKLPNAYLPQHIIEELQDE